MIGTNSARRIFYMTIILATLGVQYYVTPARVFSISPLRLHKRRNDLSSKVFDVGIF